MTTTYTTRLRLAKPDYRSSGWAGYIDDNMDIIDEAIDSLLVAANVAPWLPNTAMQVGYVRADTALSPASYWICSVAHTSGSGTFLQDRTAFPTYWSSIIFGLKPRGAWAHSTHYSVGDVAYDSANGVTGICKLDHISASTGLLGDATLEWDFIVNLPAAGTIADTTISFDNSVALLSGSPSNVHQALLALDTAIDTLKITTNSHTATLTGYGTQITILQAQVITAQSDIAAHSFNISSLQTTVTSYGGRLDALDAEVAGLGAAFATGTAMIFYQAAAPTGWTKSTSNNDKALRVVSGTGGSAGGTNSFSTVMAQTTVGNTTLTSATMPAHTHTFTGDLDTASVNPANQRTVSGGGSLATFTTNSAGSGGAHNHSITMAMQYIDVIVCTKN